MAQQYQMDGAGSVPKVGTVKGGKMWNGTKWVLLSDAPTIPSKPTPVPNTVIPAPTKTSPYAPRTEAQKATDQLALNANAQLATFENAQASGKPMPGYVPPVSTNNGGGSSSSSAYTLSLIHI